MAQSLESQFIEKLRKLNNTSQSIQALSEWLQFHKKHCKETARVWESEFITSQLEQQLCLLYLINDVLQISRKEHSLFLQEYAVLLPAALSRVYQSAQGRKRRDVQQKVERLVQVWRERHIFSEDWDAKVRKQLKLAPAAAPKAGPAAAAPTKAAPSNGDERDPKRARTDSAGPSSALEPALASLQSALEEVRRGPSGEKMPAALALVQRLQAANATTDSAVAALFPQASEASAHAALLDAARTHLDGDLERRRKLAGLVRQIAEENERRVNELTALRGTVDVQANLLHSASAHMENALANSPAPPALDPVIPHPGIPPAALSGHPQPQAHAHAGGLLVSQYSSLSASLSSFLASRQPGGPLPGPAAMQLSGTAPSHIMQITPTAVSAAASASAEEMYEP